MLVKLTSKGQTTIPRDVRVRLGLRPGDHLVVWLEGDRMIARRAELGGERPPRRPNPARDPELLEELFHALDALKRHRQEILARPDDEVLRSFAVRHMERVGRAARGISRSLRSAGSPMLPWDQLTGIPESEPSAEETRRWLVEDLDLPHALLDAYFSTVPMRGYLEASGPSNRPPDDEGTLDP